MSFIQEQPIKQLSAVDSARVVGSFLWNYFLRGPILASPFVTALQKSERSGALGVRLAQDLETRYGSPVLESWYPFRKTVLILDGGLADEILAAADAPGGPIRQAELNSAVFNRFMPDALFVSDGQLRAHKRNFNACALNTPPTEPTQHDASLRVHEFEQAFTDVAAEEVSLSISTVDGSIKWQQLANMAKSATFRIVLGSDASRQDIQDFMSNLEGAIYWASYTLGLLCRSSVRRYRSDLARYLAASGATSIVHRAQLCQGADDPASEATMWLFALKDALDTHMLRALFLILSHPQINERVLNEINSKNLDDSGDIRGLTLSEGCVHEAIRL